MYDIEKLNRTIKDCEQSIARGNNGPLTLAVLARARKDLAYHRTAMASKGMTTDHAMREYYNSCLV